MPGRQLPVFQLEKEPSDAIWELPPLIPLATVNVFISIQRILIIIYSLLGEIAVLELAD